MNERIASPAVVIHGRLDPSFDATMQKARRKAKEVAQAVDQDTTTSANLSLAQLIAQRQKLFEQDAANYRKWLESTEKFNKGEIPVGGMTGLTRHFAENSGIAGQQRLHAAERSYEDAVLEYYTSQTQQLKAGKTSASDMLLAARTLKRLEKEEANWLAQLATKQRNLDAGSSGVGPAYGTASEAAYQEQLQSTLRRDAQQAQLQFSAAQSRLQRQEKEELDQYRRAGFTKAQSERLLAGQSAGSAWSLSGRSSNSFRFAAQNVGFGVDDAIQSYQYGGTRAAIRASSNNATAIAGMLIAQPVAAAVAVIAISALSAVLPIALDKVGVDRNSRTMSRRDRRYYALTEGDSFAELQRRDWYVDRQRQQVSLNQELATSGIRSRFDAMFSAGYGSSVSTGLLSLAEVETQLGGVRGGLRGLKKEHSKAFQERWAAGRKKDDISPGFFGGLYAAGREAYHIGEPRFETELQKRIDEVEAEEITLAAQVANKQKIMSDAAKRLDFNRSVQIAGAIFQRSLGLSVTQGGMTLAKYEEALRANAARQTAVINANKALTVTERQAQLLFVQDNLQQALQNPNNQDIIRDANFAASSAAIDHFRRFGGDTSRIGQVTFEHDRALAQLRHNFNSGRLGRPDYLTQRRRVDESFLFQRQRAIQDELDNVNPERNPLRRLSSLLSRNFEDFERVKGLEPAERTNLLRNMLIGAERAREDALKPSGTRRFVSDAFEIGSRADEELRARLSGNFGPTKKQEQHLTKSLDELTKAFKDLTKQLEFEARKIEGQ